MDLTLLAPESSGLRVFDVREQEPFAGRSLRPRDLALHSTWMAKLAQTFVEDPERILQVLVDAAVAVCGADSAGISVEREDKTAEQFYEWVATSGAYSGFLRAVLPETPSACGTCLHRGGPQRFLVDQRFFDLLGVTAPVVTDGILLPWNADGQRGTIFVMAHGREEAFDAEDVRQMQMFADFAALAIRNQRQQQALRLQAAAAGSAAMANRLAHEINNPLQSLTNLVFLASNGGNGKSGAALAQEMHEPLLRLSSLVARLLTLKGGEAA